MEFGIAMVPVLLVLLTIIVVVDPRVAPATVNQRLDLVLTAIGMLVALAVAILGWIHYREGNDPSALIRASAFLVLAALNALLIAVAVLGIDAAFGLSLDAPGQLPLWTVILSRGVAAALLVIAGVAALRRWRSDEWPAALMLALPALLVTAVIVVAAAIQPSLPNLLNDAAVAQLRRDPTLPLLAASGPALIALQALIGVAMLAAAALRYRVYRRDRRRVDAYLAIGFIVAAFSQVHAAIPPRVVFLAGHNRRPACVSPSTRSCSWPWRSRRGRTCATCTRPTKSWHVCATRRRWRPRQRSGRASRARFTTGWRSNCGWPG